MKKASRKIRIFICTLIILTLMPNVFDTMGEVQAVVDHPFLIVSSNEFAELNSRAGSEPWSSWKSDAIDDATNMTVDTTGDLALQSDDVNQIASSAALAYILDNGNKSTYITRILDMVDYFDTAIYPNLNSGNWRKVVPPAAAFINLVFAVDIIHDDLTPTEVSAVETDLGKYGDWFHNSTGPWAESRIGAAGIWAIYSENQTRTNDTKNEFMADFLNQFTVDGVGYTGTGYANNRFTGSQRRDAKSHFIDVLEYTGVDTVYSDPHIQTIHEWLYGYVSTPVIHTNPTTGEKKKEAYTFGDTAPIHNPVSSSKAIYRASRFGEQAENYAARTVSGTSRPRGNLLYYVLHDQSMPSGTTVDSRIFPDGGAWFMENTTSDDALTGALWNIKGTVYHSHKDTNALHLTAYGEHTLRNVGYNGSGNDSNGFSWDYINKRAVSNNTVLIDYNNFTIDNSPPSTNDHQKKSGAGIKEGFTGGKLDYASGDSGNALPNGKHIRNFMFVHPQDGKNGYWVLFDEVDADLGNKDVHVALHPNSNLNPTTVTANTEYRSEIGPDERTANDVKLTTFMGTPPDTVQIRDGVMASWNEGYVGKYLYSTYDSNSSGRKNIVTVLFPHDNSHAKATMSRITGTGYTGASIDLGSNTIDYALESMGSGTINHSGASFEGLASMYRLNGSDLAYYFVRKGSEFSFGDQGFTADGDVSVYLKDQSGHIINVSGATREVTFEYPQIESVKLDGTLASVISSGNDWITVQVPVGTHKLELSLDGGTPPGLDELSVVDVDGSTWQTGYGPENAVDNNFNTRWAAHGIGEWIEFDLGDTYDVSRMDIAFFLGSDPLRVYSFDLDVSTNGTNWTTAYSGQSEGTTEELETFLFDAELARYVRYVGYGNSANNYEWNGMFEANIYGEPGTAAQRTVDSVTASAFQTLNPPENTLDENLNTRWSGEGQGEWIEFDLGANFLVNSVKIAFFNGDTRTSNFDLQVSSNGTNWTNVLTNQTSSGSTTQLEPFDFSSATARYVRYMGYGNSSNDWNSLTEFEIWKN